VAIYLSNAFSLSMLTKLPVNVSVSEISIEQVKQVLKGGFTSAVGHEPTAQLMSKLLNIPVPFNRIQVALNVGDILVVLQLLQRLPEGKVLSEEEIQAFPAKWLKVEVKE